MNWIDEISNNDNLVRNIHIEDNCLIVQVELWDGTIKQVRFINYYIFKDKNSIGMEIGDIKMQNDSQLLDELRKDVLNGGGTIQEIAEVKNVAFYDGWNNQVILEVLAEDISIT